MYMYNVNIYKSYKNKLINLMRCNKKEYYRKLLEENRSNIQGTWKVLNRIIQKDIGKANYPFCYKSKCYYEQH